MEIDVKRLAELAKLDIPEEKLEKVAEDLAAIVKMMENLPPLESVGPLLDEGDTMALRADISRPSLPREEILEGAPQVVKGCFAVPKMVD